MGPNRRGQGREGLRGGTGPTGYKWAHRGGDEYSEKDTRWAMMGDGGGPRALMERETGAKCTGGGRPPITGCGCGGGAIDGQGIGGEGWGMGPSETLGQKGGRSAGATRCTGNGGGRHGSGPTGRCPRGALRRGDGRGHRTVQAGGHGEGSSGPPPPIGSPQGVGREHGAQGTLRDEQNSNGTQR
jgi:hypothetical protein